MVLHRKTMDVFTPADKSTRSSVGTIDIAKGGVLIAVEIQPIDFVPTTAETAGGLVEFENDAVDWKPFELDTHGIMTLISTGKGGEYSDPFVFKCHKPLPDNSTVEIFYTAIDAGNQGLGVTLVWDTALAYKGKQTYAKSDHGTEITQVTEDTEHNSVTIPAMKGGILQAFLVKVHQTLETLVQGGGLVKITNESLGADLEPFEFFTGGATCSVAGIVKCPVEVKPVENLPAPARSVFTVSFTPWDNQSQALHFVVVWEAQKALEHPLHGR